MLMYPHYILIMPHFPTDIYTNPRVIRLNFDICCLGYFYSYAGFGDGIVEGKDLEVEGPGTR
jgi:hypothetical protein